jgi:hypothetical protein
LVAALYFADQVPPQGPCALLDWRLQDPLTRMLTQGRCTGQRGENLLVENNGKLASGWVLFAGGGTWAGLETDGYRDLVAEVLHVCGQAGFRRVGLGLKPLPGMDFPALEKVVRQAEEQSPLPGGECLLATEGG